MSHCCSHPGPSQKSYDFVSKDGNLEACYGHKMCVVAYKRTKISIDFLGDIVVKPKHTIKYEGVYMFGGLFVDASGERMLNGKLYFLPFGSDKSNRWKEIYTQGKSPEPRFHHAMHYFEAGNYLVLLGGRRLANPAPTVILNSEFVDEICLLKMETMEWKRVKHTNG